MFFERLRDKDEFINPSKFSEESKEYFELLIKWKEIFWGISLFF